MRSTLSLERTLNPLSLSLSPSHSSWTVVVCSLSLSLSLTLKVPVLKPYKPLTQYKNVLMKKLRKPCQAVVNPIALYLNPKPST